jgi:methanogenic corrinoid protein MtbC1
MVGYDCYRRDIKYHLRFLSNTLTYLSKGLFVSYIEWVKGLLIGFKIPIEDITVNFQCFKRVFESKAPGSLRTVLVEFMDAGLSQLDAKAIEIPLFIGDDFPLSELATQYLDSLLRGDSQGANQLIQGAVEKSTEIRDIYLQVLKNVQLEVDRLWHANQLTIAQEHYCTDLTRRVMDSLHPYIQSSKSVNRTLIASCVTGELHEIGIHIVSDFFKLSGWKIYFTGANTPSPDIIHAIRQQNTDLLALSVTIPWYVIEAEKLITEIRNTKEVKDVKIIVGG